MLEEQITKDVSILNANWLLIGRQVYTDFGKYIDLLAVDVTGSIIVIELDASTERIINYLNDKASIAVNAVFFTVFQDGENQYLSRAWMIDPVETDEVAANTGKKGVWNGEFYGSFGAAEDSRNWQDAMAHGFISAGLVGIYDWYNAFLDLSEKRSSTIAKYA